MDREQLVQQALELPEVLGIEDQYEIIAKLSPNRTVHTLTLLHRGSGAHECYLLGYPPNHPRYWLRLLEQALVEQTFGSGHHQITAITSARSS